MLRFYENQDQSNEKVIDKGIKNEIHFHKTT